VRADLRIDFTRTGGPVAAGYEAYYAGHESAGTFTAQAYAAFGTTVTVWPAWPQQPAPQAMQMIQRSSGSDLVVDWIGTDARVSQANPLVLTITGLPAGAYTWTSYHHDPQDQTGLFDVTVTDAFGSSTTAGVDISNGNLSPDAMTAFQTYVVSDGHSPVTLSFDALRDSPVSQAFFVMNALVLETLNPCLNVAPLIEGPDLLSVRVHEPVTVDVTVSDDGLPWVEGCDPDQVEVGTSLGLTYAWSQLSGPLALDIESGSGDQEDLLLSFPQQGVYELRLQVSDGPIGGAPEQGKAAEYLVTVHALDATSSSSVVINEFLASNGQGLLDGDGKSSDWIEMYNPGPDPAFLGGWALTDDQDDLLKWTFPAASVLLPGEYLVVFASGRSIQEPVDAAGHMHANFSLRREGEYLALVDPHGTVVQAFAPVFPPQYEDISYGMWHGLPSYFAVPTPRQANAQAFPGFTDRTLHSRGRGFCDEPFDLDIVCTTPGAVIYYSLDGSAPTEDTGLIYDPDAPIPISTTTQVRSVAVKPGWRSAPVTTHSYIFVDDVAQQPANPPDWPLDWGYSSDAGAVVPADYEMDPRVVDSTLPGYSVQEALLDIPSMSVSMHPDAFISDATGIYANPQSRWERPCSVEYILPGGADGFQVDCKIEIHGNASRRPYRMQKHSLRLTFTRQYGPAKLEYPLFPDSDIIEFNQLVLRACFTDSWGLVSWSSSSRYRPNDSQYTRDVWMKESLGAMGQPSSRGNFVHVYVNGLYFGIHNLTERVSDDFFADHLGGEPEDWEINVDLSQPRSHWAAMMGVNPGTPAGYLQIQDFLDVENFADYMLLHFYADAEDWPHHNGYAAANPVSGDGRFRFFVWDQEIVLDYHGRAQSRINNSRGAGAVFQKLRASKEFRLLFADRVYKHCFNNGALSVTVSQERYQTIAGWIDKAIVAESARWGDTQVSTPYGNPIEQPRQPGDINDNLYPPAPHGPDYYFTREDSWAVERDNVINNYIPAIHDLSNSFALINTLRRANLYPDFDPPVFFVNTTQQHGGQVSAGDLLFLAHAGASGTIYYTVDGTDPRLPDTAGTVSSQPLVAEAAPKAVWLPTEDIGLVWTGGDEPFDDSSWLDGTQRVGGLGGVGYERGSGYASYLSYDVASGMYGARESCYVRVPFGLSAEDLAGFNYLILHIRYDDGFVAYLNGKKIAAANAPGSPVWNDGATASHSDGAAVNLQAFDCSDALDHLRAGDNLLAIHGLNYRSTSSDFLISVELVAGEDSAAQLISPSALVYTDPIVLTEDTRIEARVWQNGQWSALHEADYMVNVLVRDE